MSEFLNILTHGRRLKSAVKELSLSELEEVAIKLNKVIADRREEEAELLKLQAEKQQKIEELRKAMDEAGIGMEDLVGEGATAVALKPRKKRAAKPPKYEIYTSTGEHITWTGQGRMPKALKQELDRGQSLDSFLIK